MAGTRNNEEFLRLCGQLVGFFAKLDGMRVFSGDEQHRARRNRLDVIERIEIHKLGVAGQCRVRCKFGR